MFHRYGGKAFFYVITLLFLVVSVQNTWQFLVTILPDATPVFIGGMMIVFEGGVLGWLALLMHGTENIPRTIIAALMLLITGVGVGTAAYFELDGLMHKSIAVKIDSGFLANVPNIVNGVYLATFVAIVLYILASPTFGERMRHMNTHGTPPARTPQIVTGHLVQLPQEASTQQPKTVVTPVAQPAPAQLPAPQPAQKMGWFSNPFKRAPQPLPAYLPPPSLSNEQWQEMYDKLKNEMRAERAVKADEQQSKPTPQEAYAQDLVDDLANSVGGDTGPFTSAPSPNGAKPK